MGLGALQGLLFAVGGEHVPITGRAMKLERTGDHLVLDDDNVVLLHKVMVYHTSMPEVTVVEDGGEGTESAAVGGALAAATLAGASTVKADAAQQEAEDAKAQAAAAQATADLALSQPAGVSHEEVGAIVEDKLAVAFDRLAERLAPPAPVATAAVVEAKPVRDEPPKSVEKQEAKKKSLRERWGG